MKKYTIAIIEDRKQTYDAYKRALSKNLNIEISHEFELSTIPCTSEMTPTELEEKLKLEQPDILFLDYELSWRDGSEFDAPDFVGIIQKVYLPMNYPPFIVLNTAQEQYETEVHKILNLSKDRNDIEKQFVGKATPEMIEFDKEIICLLMQEAKQILQKDREPINWEHSGITFYPYPSFEQQVPHVPSADREDWKTITGTYVQGYLQKHKKLIDLHLNYKNIIAIIQHRRPTAKHGCLFYVTPEGLPAQVIVKYDTLATLREFLSATKIAGYMKIEEKKHYYNKQYIQASMASDEQYSFKPKFKALKDLFNESRNLELAQFGIDKRNHAIYRQMKY